MANPDHSESAGFHNTPSGHDVFVSHSSKDREAADSVCRALESRGIRCWMAPRDIRPGANWGESILEAIGRVKLMVLLLSANANASPQVLREVERAVNKSVVVIPVRIENVMPSASLEYFLSTAHWLDAYESPLERHCRKLADAVQGMLQGKDFAPFVSASPVAPVSRSSRRWIGLIAGGLAAAVIAALSFVAGGWWLRSKPPAENVPPFAQIPGAFVLPAATAGAAASSSPVQSPPPSIADFAGQWEIAVVTIEDVAGNSSYYGPIRFAVDNQGKVSGKAALNSEERNGEMHSHRPPIVLDLQGSISNPAWKSLVPFPVAGVSQDFSYSLAEISFRLEDGAEGTGKIGFSDQFPVTEQLTIKKGDAFGTAFLKRTGPLEDESPAQLRVGSLQPGDVVADGAWFFWFRPEHGSDRSEKVAELDLATGELVLRINGKLERLRRRSETWNPSRDRGPTVGDQGEEVWFNARVEVRLSFQITEAEHEFSRFAGQMRVSAEGQTVVLMVEGETGA
ncbi:MAG: TIR domain-containing protein [Chthoniobacterales bacterium]